MTFTLLGYGPGDGLEDISPFCLKVVNYLRWTNTDYEPEITDPRRTPRGKLPCLIYGEEVVPDSSGIIHYLETRHAIRLDDHLSAQEHAQGRLIQSVFEEHLYFILIYWRWTDQIGWSHYKAHLLRYFDDIGVPSSSRKPSLERQKERPTKYLGARRWSDGPRSSTRKRRRDPPITQHPLDDRAFFVGNEPNSYDASCLRFSRIHHSSPYSITSPDLGPAFRQSSELLRTDAKALGKRHAIGTTVSPSSLALPKEMLL